MVGYLKLGNSAVASEFCDRVQVGINISLIVSIKSSLTHLHGFQLLVLLPLFIEITFFICTSKINLLNLKESPDRLVIFEKDFWSCQTYLY